MLMLDLLYRDKVKISSKTAVNKPARNKLARTCTNRTSFRLIDGQQISQKLDKMLTAALDHEKKTAGYLPIWKSLQSFILSCVVLFRTIITTSH